MRYLRYRLTNLFLYALLHQTNRIGMGKTGFHRRGVTFTVQPLVENAVRHGICKRPKGGTVTIRSYETDSAYVIEIADDGVGFDTESITTEGETHVGIENVRARLAYFGDTLEIKSEIGVGTTAAITVPKKGEKRR